MQPTPMTTITAATRDEAKPEAGPLPVPIAANSPDLNNDPDDTHDTDPVVQRIKERIALALSRSKQDSTTAALKSAPAQPGPEIRPTHEGPASSPPQSPITAPPENRRERLLRNEAIIERTLHTKDEMAMALLIILTEKLYKETHAAAGVYLKERWGFSRSRGYQLVRHARLLVQSRQQGQSAPANERQSRRLSADGTRSKTSRKTLLTRSASSA